jgi:hypothetical protein
MQQTRSIGTDLNAGPDLADGPRLLVDVYIEASLEQCERGRQPTDATPTIAIESGLSDMRLRLFRYAIKHRVSTLVRVECFETICQAGYQFVTRRKGHSIKLPEFTLHAYCSGGWKSSKISS